ncbi:hypothetical protein [Hymenobacter lapidiphilus]|uniref:Uncharacterized protein n=1 Tax=Hymenobacter lapidiphilus TaxID=2608003 RepID=A0A7Y7U6A6_9BACT|nr:hypothetical protein [Hymenobacter lapidiphilus]NVO32308.1 hypothetical protein [Hymenobacter lapidiphilus]
MLALFWAFLLGEPRTTTGASARPFVNVNVPHMLTSLRAKILLILMVVGLFVAGAGIGANVRRDGATPAGATQGSGLHLAPVAGFLTWGGLGLVFGCFMLLTIERKRQEKTK